MKPLKMETEKEDLGKGSLFRYYFIVWVPSLTVTADCMKVF